MNQALVDRIVSAVLYEGYILYPYRPSVKNRQRWTFGGLYPREYCLAHAGAEPSIQQTECLVVGSPDTVLDVTVRFLHLVSRQVGERTETASNGEPTFRHVESLRVGDQRFFTWQEAVERSDRAENAALGSLIGQVRQLQFQYPTTRVVEPLRDDAGNVGGVMVREQQAVQGTVELSAENLDFGLFKLTVRICNETPLANAAQVSRDQAQRCALMSTHSILVVRAGEFVSLLDPPDAWRAHAARCHNEGTWPVLVGAEGEKDTMLSTPIILYDYPQIAPESPGDLFDATEIDEILTLRILALTDEEKQDMAALDPRARALLQRTETLAREQLMGLHGTMRKIREAGR